MALLACPAVFANHGTSPSVGYGLSKIKRSHYVRTGTAGQASSGTRQIWPSDLIQFRQLDDQLTCTDRPQPRRPRKLPPMTNPNPQPPAPIPQPPVPSPHPRHPIRCRRPPGRSGRPRSDPARLGPHPPRLEGRLQLPGNQRRLLLRQRPGDRRERPAELRVGNQAALARLQRHASTGLVKASPGKGQATEVQATAVTVHGTADADDLSACRRRGTPSSSSARSPICGRGPTPSAPSPGCATASATRSTSSSRSEGFLYVHTPIITASDCEGAGRDVPGHHARPGQTAASKGRRESISRTTSSTGRPI